MRSYIALLLSVLCGLILSSAAEGEELPPTFLKCIDDLVSLRGNISPETKDCKDKEMAALEDCLREFYFKLHTESARINEDCIASLNEMTESQQIRGVELLESRMQEAQANLS